MSALKEYRDWILAKRKSRFDAAPASWRAWALRSGSVDELKINGRRIVREIDGRPVAEGAEREE